MLTASSAGSSTWPKEAHLPALANLKPLGTLQAIYSRSQKSAAALAETAAVQLNSEPLEVYFDSPDDQSLDKLLSRSDIDAVIIAVPINSQPDLIRRAWAAGKHVASEKPVAGDLETASELIKLYRQQYEPQGLKWHILENFAHEPAYLAARDGVAKGEIGKLTFFSYSVCFHVDTANRFYQTEWRNKPTHAGGFLLDGGVHHSAALHLALPSPPVSVSALTSLNNEYLAPSDTLHALITCEDGSVGTFQLSFGSSPTFVQEELRLVGSTGHLSVSAATAGARQAGFAVSVHAGGSDKPKETFYESNGVELAIRCFLKAVLGEATEEEEQRAGAERARRDVEFVLKCLGSEGKPVKL
ncbi:hypothetical protein BCR35DRAFT_319434 [Leucosporidium creatinivorum]|uniref:NAD(P)-binding protein n=1 Tax=Leucosporidium creatinivorum TaxID=106004 RepID=A0A1Y2DEK7_9BASI|nr:hypothetical protein BCR35DRAFT_319434 [Leucosporidium creatinivorum]